MTMRRRGSPQLTKMAIGGWEYSRGAGAATVLHLLAGTLVTRQQGAGQSCVFKSGLVPMAISRKRANTSVYANANHTVDRPRGSGGRICRTSSEANRLREP